MKQRLVVLASLALTSLSLTLMTPGVLQGFWSSELQVKPPGLKQTDSEQELPQSPTLMAGVNPTSSAGLKDTNYPIPNNAYFVSLTGNDANSGKQGAPWRTLRKAISSAPNGSTIVLRGGTYREGHLTLKKKLNLQPYPREQVWFKGSLVVTGWAADGAMWRKDNWTYQFKPISPSSPEIDKAYPQAGYLETVFVDGQPLAQVLSKGEVGPGKFYLDRSNNQLFVGANPNGKTVEASAFRALFRATPESASSTIKGLGFGYYADTAVGLYGSNTVVENNTFAWNGRTGLRLNGSDSRVKGNTFTSNGEVGLGGTRAYRTIVEKNNFSYNNLRNFARGYGAAGTKFTRGEGLIFRDNVFEHNNGKGLWLDISCINTTIVRNVTHHNKDDGIFFEISHRAIIASNLSHHNGRHGISVHNSTSAQVFNNTLVRNAVNLSVGDTNRVNPNPAEYKAGITWQTANIVVKNNLFSNTEGGVEGWGPLLVNIYSTEDVPGRKVITEMNNNGYYRTSASSPAIAIRYRPSPRSNVLRFKTVKEFAAKTGFDKNALAVDNTPTNPFFINEAKDDYQLKSGSRAIRAGAPLPTRIASAVGIPAGTKVSMGTVNLTGAKQTALQDVQGHWAQAYIQAIAARNIISGFPDGTFRPNAPVTRAEFAAMVTKAFTPKQRSNNVAAFRDVPRSFWGYRAIQSAARGGFLAGYPSGVFRPNQHIPKVQALVSLASGLNLSNKDISILSFYQDAAQIPVYAADKVAAMTQQKIVVNYPTIRRLNPNQEATRAEVAAFVYQTLARDGKVEPIASPYLVAPSS